MRTVIVDSDDNILGAKNGEDLKFDDIYRVSALWLTNSQGQILLAKRKMTKKTDPGKWGPAVSGTIEEGETYESNIYKEAEEEIGLTGHRFTVGPKVLNPYGNYTFFAQWFLCSLDWPLDKFKLQEDEVEELAWVGKDFLIKELENSPSKYIVGAAKVFESFL
ncbi:MAG: isopentenyl-diphosphate delta-isomerase, isopentenyl-diphosphate delta-isomerase [Candidatus Saccharibacteria bacterium]|nr:isopentenyl-diphosphate delta-isomerase, isopentenyl-diphosphate delta-isomerase [Candidatus Saccharibacteria bacterium]